MKKIYKILLCTFLALFVLTFILGRLGLSAKTLIGNACGLAILFLPLEVLFWMLGKDQEVSKNKRVVFRIVFWYIAIAYFLGLIANLIAK